MAWVFKGGEKPNILQELILAAVGELWERFREEGPNLGASDTPECFISR